MVEALEQGTIRSWGAYFAQWALQMPDETALTFVDYLGGRGPFPAVGSSPASYTWAELDVWTRAIGTVLNQLAAPGDRVAILAGSGPEYVAAFSGALRAGLIAVPLFAPDLFGHAERLESVLADCDPRVIVTTADKHDLVVDFLTARGLPVPAMLCPDDLLAGPGGALADRFQDAEVDPDDVAYLQYTSGSTRTPAGVEVTHRNVVCNALQMIEPHGLAGRPVTAVGWLPLFHDMGLMLIAAAPVVLGVPAVLMDPVAFVLKPARWLQLIGSYQNTFSAAPNFAYDLAARRVSPEDLAGIDLSRVIRLVNGAEPIMPASVRRFTEAFVPYGLDPASISPSYGLAEATLLVCATPTPQLASVLTADVAALQQGRLVPTTSSDAAGTGLIASGRPAQQSVVIVEPAQRRLLADGEVGEIWVRGPNVARGYWSQPALSAATFGAELATAPTGTVNGPWLRTGDLGALRDGELFVTGRIKDLMVVDGRNIYPHDVELSVQQAHRAIALNRLAAFSIERPGDGNGAGEAVVVVAELHKSFFPTLDGLDEIDRAVRRYISDQHGVALHELVLVRRDAVLRTSSGKIARQATREAYLGGTLDRIELTAAQEI